MGIVMIVYELFVLDKNTWNYINVYKQMIINWWKEVLLEKSVMGHWMYNYYN